MKPKINRILSAIIAACCCLILMQGSLLAESYQHAVRLKKMSFEWSIKGEKLYVKLTAATKGWVGIGFNPTRRMQDANYVLGYVKNGKVSVTDAFGVRPKEHINDTVMQGRNDITDVSGSEEGRTTTIMFAIPLDSGDAADGVLKKDGYTTVLLAFGRSRDNFYERHRYRTSLKVNLSTGRYLK